jgi:hypothetical protein
MSKDMLLYDRFFLDWRVLNKILKEVPQILKNKALVLSGNWEFDPAYELASTLCQLVRVYIF